MEYTLVLGVDESHLEQLKLVWSTWKRHKPTITDSPIVVFYDRNMSKRGFDFLLDILGPDECTGDFKYVEWPPKGVVHKGIEGSKWYNPQRYRMLSGFVHVPPAYVKTPYWLKLDLDVIATGMPDWIDEQWFEGNPSIISHSWSYTKPAEQMLVMDNWIEENKDQLPAWSHQSPLNLAPKNGSSLVRHKRIISWCAFFSTEFTKLCSQAAERCCGEGQLPVPSQDGYMWYMAERAGFKIKRVNMKSRGWEHRSSTKNVRQSVERAMA